MIKATNVGWLGALFFTAPLAAETDALRAYGDLKHPPTPENFSKGWKERTLLEFQIVNDADLESLRAALTDEKPFVRAIAARALGIRGDRRSATAIAKLLAQDPEPTVRIRAVEALGLLKLEPEAIEKAKDDKWLGVQWSARLAAEQLRSKTDYAAVVRQSFQKAPAREAIGAAKVGERAPDFSVLTLEGKTFRLSSVLGKKPIAIYFAAFDG